MRVHSSAGETGRIWRTGDYTVHVLHRCRAVEVAEAVRGYLESKPGRLVRLCFEAWRDGLEAARAQDVDHVLSTASFPDDGGFRCTGDAGGASAVTRHRRTALAAATLYRAR